MSHVHVIAMDISGHVIKRIAGWQLVQGSGRDGGDEPRGKVHRFNRRDDAEMHIAHESGAQDDLPKPNKSGIKYKSIDLAYATVSVLRRLLIEARRIGDLGAVENITQELRFRGEDA